MDVHAPHERIHGWRDFFVHLITITIGLLIALSLEGTLEWFHHRHLVREALETIHLELTNSRKLLAGDLTSIREDESRIRADIGALVLLRSGTKIPRSSLEYRVDWSSFSDSAWRTAEATGALNFMDYETVEALAGVYGQLNLVSGRGIKIFDDQSRAIAPVFITGDPNSMSKDEIQLSLQRSADLLLDLHGLEQLLSQLDGQLTEELERSAGR